MSKYKSFIIIKNHIFIYTASLLVLFAVFTGINSWSHRQEVRQTQMDMTYLKTYRLNDLGRQEKYNRYLDFCIRIWNVYGKTYHRPSKLFKIPQAMDLTLRHKVWKLNFELAELMGFADNGYGYFYIITKGVMEGSLNPNAKGLYGEHTWLQIKPIAVIYAKGIYELYIPQRWKKKLAFNFTGDMDMLGSEDALKIGYILAWWYKSLYKDQKLWGVSTYHWGDGWFGSHFANGFGTLPEKFTISEIEYDPLGYYIAWSTMNDAFNNGQIEAGESINADYQARKIAMSKEEANLLGNKKAIKKMSKRLKKIEFILTKKDALIDEGLKEIRSLNKIISIAMSEIRETTGTVQKWRVGNIREYMQSRNDLTVKNMLKALKTDYRGNKNRYYWILGLGSLLIILNLVVIIYHLRKWRKK